MTPVEVGTAQHEAAHVVVGVALGLPLIEATALATYVEGIPADGSTWFRYSESERPALALMYAAGIAWEALAGRDLSGARYDRKAIRGLGYAPRGIRALTVAADAILRTRAGAHARVTRALLDRGRLTGADIYALAMGEKIDRDDA